MSAITLAISLSEAKDIALGLVALFGVGAIASAWIMKTILQKIAVAAILGVLAFAVFSQRTSLEDCADKVRDVYALRDDAVDPNVALDTDCSFFGTTISIRDPRNTDDNE